MEVLDELLKKDYLSQIAKTSCEKANMHPFIKIVRHDLKLNEQNSRTLLSERSKRS